MSPLKGDVAVRATLGELNRRLRDVAFIAPYAHVSALCGQKAMVCNVLDIVAPAPIMSNERLPSSVVQNPPKLVTTPANYSSVQLSSIDDMNVPDKRCACVASQGLAPWDLRHECRAANVPPA